MKNTMNHSRGVVVLWSLVIGLGCQVTSSLGNTPVQNDGGGPPELPTVPPDEPFSYPDGVAGSWTGYFEAFPFLGGDAIALSLGQNAQGANEIRIVLGAGAPPPAPTGAADPWPPYPATPYPSNLVVGASYVAHQVRWQGRRLTFWLAAYEPYEAWCELQASVFPLLCTTAGQTCTGCAPSKDPRAGSCWPTNNPSMTVSCAQIRICDFGGPCACDGIVCIAHPERGILFDITFDPGNTTASGAGLSLTLKLMR